MQRVAVVVLNYNKKTMVLECLESLAKQNYQSCGVIVVDNASTDGSGDAIRSRYPEVALLINETNLGAIGGRNAGVDFARASSKFDFILFLDDDAAVAPDSIGLLVDALDRDSAAGIACGKTYVDFDSKVLMSTGIVARLHQGRCFDRGAGEGDSGQYDQDGYVDACGAFAFLIHASLFERLGGFDRAFTPYGWEDVDLCLRARQSGYRTRYVSRAHFIHRGTRQGREPIPSYERNKVRNFIILMLRHTTWLGKLCAVVMVPLRWSGLVARFASQGHWRAISAQLSGVRDYLSERRRGGTH